MNLDIAIIILHLGKILRVICPSIWLLLLIWLQSFMRNYSWKMVDNYRLYIFKKYTSCGFLPDYKCISMRFKRWSQCANHLYANRNLRYSKWWPSFLLCCFWRVFCDYEVLFLLWFCLLSSIFKQHYYLRRFIWSEVLCFSISCLNHQTWREFRRIICLLVTWH